MGDSKVNQEFRINSSFKGIGFAWMLFLSFVTSASAQYHEALYEMYFVRQPSARVEAMGRGSVALNQYGYSSLYNPALPANETASGIDFGHSGPMYMLKNAEFFFFSGYYKITPKIVCGISNYRIYYNNDEQVVDPEGNVLGSFERVPYITTFSFAANVFPHLYVGMNINRVWDGFRKNVPKSVHIPYIEEESKAYPMDIGALYKMTIGVDDCLQFGANFANIARSELKYKNGIDKLPQFFSVGSSYQASWNPVKIHSEFMTGIELTGMEIISIRAGYYRQRLDDLGSAENLDVMNSRTWGLGLQLPFWAFTSVPIVIRVDYASLPQQRYTHEDIFEFKNFRTINIGMTFVGH